MQKLNVISYIICSYCDSYTLIYEAIILPSYVMLLIFMRFVVVNQNWLSLRMSLCYSCSLYMLDLFLLRLSKNSNIPFYGIRAHSLLNDVMRLVLNRKTLAFWRSIEWSSHLKSFLMISIEYFLNNLIQTREYFVN